MNTWHDVAITDEFKITQRKIVEIDDLRILVINLNDQYYAVESLCSHAMFELDDAIIENCEIICPLHGAHFCLKSGAALTPPAFENLRTFPIRITGYMVQIQLSTSV